MVARNRPEHDVKRLPWTFADCTPSLLGVLVDAYAVYAATAFLESEARARTAEEDEESARSLRLLYTKEVVCRCPSAFVCFGAG